MTPLDRVRVCAVCARTLECVVPTENGRDLPELASWRHGIQDSPADHPAVPVEAGEIHAAMRCDFCNVEDPSWDVPVADFTMSSYEDQPREDSAGGWAACARCAELIQSNQWSALLRHAVASFMMKHPDAEEAEVWADVGKLYRDLRRNMLGPPRPL